MKKMYESPEMSVMSVTFVDTLAVSQSVDPENPIPDVTAPGDDFDFDW